MLENLVAWVLNTYVGEYLENLNTNQLSIALLQGQVELENVPLKKTALRKFDIPLQVRSGLLGKLTLSVPLTHIRSEPWVVKMSDLLVLLEPTHGGKYDVEAVEVYEQSKKEQQLEELEKFHKKQLLLNAGLPTEDDRAQQSWWGASLVSAVVNNVQLILTNVHIRYEDDTTVEGTPFCCGVRIHNVSVQTTDSRWKAGYMQPREGVNVFKKLEIGGLSVYWNSDQKRSPDITSHKDLQMLLAPEVNKDNTYILQPFSAHMYMEKNTSKFPLKSRPAIPRFKFELRPEQVTIELSRRQMAEIRLLGREWARYERARQHRKWRPLVTVGGNAKEWWNFAYNRVQDEAKQRNAKRTWKFALMRARHLNAYCRAYRRKLLAHLEAATAQIAKTGRSSHSQSSHQLSTVVSAERDSANASTSVPLRSAPHTAATTPATGSAPSSPLALTSEDVVLMKQVERDADYTYHELHLFRETVFRHILDERENERIATTESGMQSDDDTFETVEPLLSQQVSEHDLRTATEKYSREQISPTQSEGLYGWLSSWFSAPQPQRLPKDESADSTEVNASEWTDSEAKADLAPLLKLAEKQLEDEIMDVLTESWDDSTVLRRDTLLAAVSLQLEHMMIRFVDDDDLCLEDVTRVLSMDLWQVVSKVQLSPRQHSTAMSLSVGDLSIQRLYMTSTCGELVDLPSTESGSTQPDDDSLMFGFGGSAMKETTQILFAIGKMKSPADGNLTCDNDSNARNLIPRPLFQMRYRRHAPMLLVRHTVDADLSAISVMYDEGAFDGLSNFFDTNAATFNQKSNSPAVPEVEVSSHLFLTIRVPEIHIELKSKRNGLMGERKTWQSGSPFAFATVKKLALGVSSTEPYLTEVKLAVGSVDVKDLFERNEDILIRTQDPGASLGAMKTWSVSCPSLTNISSDLESSTFTRAMSFGCVPQTSDSSVESGGTRKSSRAGAYRKQKMHAEFSDAFRSSGPEMSLINFTIVNSRHPLFESVYKKVNCSVDARLPAVIVGMNRRSWTMLFDFFGFLGRLPTLSELTQKLPGVPKDELRSAHKTFSETSISKRSTSGEFYGLKISVRSVMLRINMNYASNKTQLGVLRTMEPSVLVQVMLGDEDEPLRAALSFTSLTVSDTTPFYSTLYGERLVLQPSDNVEQSESRKSKDADNSSSQSRIAVDIIKYFPPDPQLKRKYDMRVAVVVPNAMNVAYVHTHRYMCALIDFWLQFFELQDQVIKKNKLPNELQPDGHRGRVQLDVDVRCASTIILPLNQLSNQAIICETAALHISNEFKFANSILLFEEHSIENQYGIDDDKFSCLMDWITVRCSQIAFYESVRVSNAAASAPPVEGFKRICEDIFATFHFMRANVNVLSRFYDLTVNAFRNLDGCFSHRVPDVAVITELSDLGLKFTSDFYRLLRGFLEKNLGDPLVPVPETIPIEVLQKPVYSCEVGSSNKYATFALRISFRSVEFNCFVPSEAVRGGFNPFATMRLNRSRISFDVFIDNQSELDLICESTELFDSRFEGLGAQHQSNVFTRILCPRTLNDANSAQLMSEAHLMMKKDEPPVLTLVLLNARVLLVLDWLNDAKNFVLLNTDFVPPVEDIFHSHCEVDSSRSGVIHRSHLYESTEFNEQTISLKITLRESDLILLEVPSSADSLALVAHCTAVLNMTNPHGLLTANLEIQEVNIDWCVMSAENESRCQLTNDFSATIVLSGESDVPITEQARALLSGLPSLTPAKHRLTIGVNDMVARVSYTDALVIKNVLECSLTTLAKSMENSVVPKSASPSANKGGTQINIVRVLVKSEKASLWLLDDFQGTAFPLIRLLLTKFSLERHLDRIAASFVFAVDYFNERVFGWEPLLEPWRVQHFVVTTRPNNVALELHAEDCSTLDINITQVLVQQALHFKSRWPLIKQSFDTNFRSTTVRSRSDHQPYLLRNETGSDLRFTTAVDEVLESRTKQRKSTVKWFAVAAGSVCPFEFPTKRLVFMEYSDEPRQLIIRVDGWDEISAVNVDSVGTYFRVARYAANKTSSATTSANARLVVAVSMDKDGRKVVTVRSALTVVNHLPDSVLLIVDNQKCDFIGGTAIFRVGSGEAFPVPLKFANAQISVKPEEMNVVRARAVDWHEVRNAGEVINKTIFFETTLRQRLYWMCTSVKREHYPEYEMLPGHTILLMPPLTVLNLLPIDAEFIVSGTTFAIAAGKQLHITSVNISNDINFRVSTDRFVSTGTVSITRAILSQKPGGSETHRLDIRMRDTAARLLDMYGSVSVGRGGAVSLSFWVPYWIVNKSGIPLIIKQEASEDIAAGQFEEHERAKDRHPLMFSFADDNCPKQCIIRAGKNFAKDSGYKPEFSHKFALTVGVHSLKLFLTHEHAATLIYNIGVEVRQGTGRYKDTQVVLLTPRYLLSNQTSHSLLLSHVDYIDQPSQHVTMASKCSLVWNENFEDKRMLCVKRDGVKYWSCPFRIDQISSFHVTMRDADETPQFVRVEIILNSAVFCVTFTDARYFPPPIQLENLSDVPVLYHQKTDRSDRSYLRTICKARSTVDYAWDDHYGCKLLTLQVFENKSHSYDPQKPGLGPPLIYDNNVYIKLAHSFRRGSRRGFTDENELVLEVMQKGKVMMNKMNVSDSSRNQLWRFTADGCLENVGMNNRARPGERYVLDVLDRGGYMLMMLKRNTARDVYQNWHITADKRLRCQKDGVFVEGRRSDVLLAKPNPNSSLNKDGVPLEQVWELQTQRPGSGILDVECLHKGPTLIVRITDRANPGIRSGSESRLEYHSLTSTETRSNLKSDLWNFEMNISMRGGIGISLINGQHEELIYARFHGIALHANRRGQTYQITNSVELIQVDNQLLSTERWQVLYCQQNALTGDPDPADHMVMRPALKLEMNCSPFEHYDAFDCFRVKLCDMSVQLDELLMWKLIQFVQESEAADSVQPSALVQPPNTELERADPAKARRCYFGTLDLEVGGVALSVVTVAKSGLPPELRKLRRQFNIKLVSFENAMISLPPFRQFRYFETFSFLMETLSKFYLAELKNQTLNIIVTMDAFGNPMGLASDLKESFEGLFFEGDFGGFVSGLGYGVTNSISKVASSVAHGVGTLTFDEQHELMRRRMLRCQPQADSNSALAHLYSGVKGLGVGVFGGLTAIVTNTYTESKRDGIAGAIRGITTGAVDTVTKPVQGIFDLVEGTASAMKEIVGGPTTRKSHFAEKRIRLSRVCTNLQSLLPCYSEELAAAQMDLLRINGFSTSEILLDVEVVLDRRTNKDRIRQYALICSEQCYVIRQVDEEPSNVVQRIPYKHLKLMQPMAVSEHNATFASIEIVLELSSGKRQRLPHLWCNKMDVAKRLCEKVARAKQLYDHSKRTLTVAEDYDIL
uniref:Vacuolar protein sorting-associated protein 13D n=5 Tax=Parascaris univalens TaxID=6257 RepID=A0A915ASC0_PARUN